MEINRGTLFEIKNWEQKIYLGVIGNGLVCAQQTGFLDERSNIILI